MPEFMFTSPEGKKITVTGPEGATQEQAFEIAKKQLGDKVAAPKESTDARSAIADFFKSIPRGALQGLASAASAMGQAESASAPQTPQDVELAKQVPGAAESTKLLENNVTGELPKPQGTAGKVGAGIGETLANPVSWVGPGGLATKTASAVGGSVGGELMGEIAKQINPAWEAAGKLFGGLAGGAGGARVGAGQEGRSILE